MLGNEHNYRNELNSITAVGTKSAWTPERRARQAQLIQRAKPWEHSTGPKTEAGKATSARNAYKGDTYHDCMAAIANSRSISLYIFGRQR